MTYYDEELQRLSAQVARKTHLQKMLKSLYDQKSRLDIKVEELESIKNDEQRDVEKLEGRSLTAFLYECLGKKEAKLDEERKQAYAASAKYDVAFRELSAIKSDIQKYENELQDLLDCEKSYAKILGEKAAVIKDKKDHNAERILHLEKEITYLQRQKKEIREAINVGEEAKNITNQLLEKIQEAKNWGIYDLLAGGVTSSTVKHITLDEAQELTETLQVKLNRFSTELSDTAIDANIKVNIEGFLRFADCFLDSFFADYEVLEDIKESEKKVKNTAKEIENILNHLSELLSDFEEERLAKKEALHELIVNTDI